MHADRPSTTCHLAGAPQGATASGELRIVDPALRPAERISFNFNGRPVGAHQGESIAAALAACDVVDYGSRRDGTPRGLWCGMGVCQECVVNIDGMPSVRACMTLVANGMDVTAQGYRVAVPPARPRRTKSTRSEHRPALLVVGAGPAGLSVARAAALCGIEVTVIDERTTPGGQYFKQIAKSQIVVDRARTDAQVRRGHDLITEVEAAGVTLLRNAEVWGAFSSSELAVTIDGDTHVFRPDRLVLATGAYERGIPVPGWTLPGYMTTGAAQTLLRSYRVAPGRQVVVAGNGPLNLQLAAELVAVGINVVAVVEAAMRPGLRQAGALLRCMGTAPDLIGDGLRYLARLRRAGVPVMYASAVIAAHGRDRVETCVISKIDAAGRSIPHTAIEVQADTVCTGYGFLPSDEIGRALGCRQASRGGAGTLATTTDGDGLTSVPGVYAIGDAVALGGAHAGQHQGFVTGCAVARSLGHALPTSIVSQIAFAQRRLRRHQAFQKALWQVFKAPVLQMQLSSAETIICRCEGVTCRALQAAIDQGAATLGAIKRRTRAGMGRCQGRSCEALLEAMMIEVPEAAPRDETFTFAPRPPFKPMRIQDLV